LVKNSKYYYIFVVLALLSFKESNLNIATSLNELSNPSALDFFYNELDSLVQNSDRTVSIVHIGDSHIQADYLTGTTRRKLQNDFGNAGRGFVFPYNIARSGGAIDVKFKHKGNWNFCEIMRSYANCNIGVSGYSLSPSNNSSVYMDVATKATSNASFNQIEILDSKGSFIPTIHNGSFSVDTTQENTVIRFSQFQDSLELSPVYSSNLEVKLKGMILKNGQPGILYHAMGVNGSSTLQYLRSNSFEKDIADLNASLVIISFGTNDCYLPRSRFCQYCIKDRYKTMIARIKSKNPKASILITTPPDHYYYRKYPNKNINGLRNALLTLAEEEQVAIWDLYGVMGGENSIKSWYNADLARRDLIHFTKEGYYKQGELLYDAIMHHYQER
jgi:lysophospholipase L1-like esterase